LDAMVPLIYNVYATVRYHHDVTWPVELSVASAIRVPFANEHAFGGELLNPVVG
jgi:hypothetical protein